jgi:hypothetical protein
MRTLEESEEICRETDGNEPAPFGKTVEAKEILAAPAWRLPGGESLAQFALRGGFVATHLMAGGLRRLR